MGLLETISITLIQINFASKYFALCNGHSNLNDKMSVKKDDISKILLEVNFPMLNSSKEFIFYRDYSIKNYNIRFILPYKFGIIDCSEVIWNEDNSVRVYGTFRDFFTNSTNEDNEKLKYLFPICTNQFELQHVVKSIIQLHIEFIQTLSENLEST